MEGRRWLRAPPQQDRSSAAATERTLGHTIKTRQNNEPTAIMMAISCFLAALNPCGCQTAFKVCFQRVAAGLNIVKTCPDQERQKLKIRGGQGPQPLALRGSREAYSSKIVINVCEKRILPLRPHRLSQLSCFRSGCISSCKLGGKAQEVQCCCCCYSDY